MLGFLADLFRSHWILTIFFTLLFTIVYKYVWKSWTFFSDRNVKFVRGWPILGSIYRAQLGLEPGAISYKRCYDAFPNEKIIGVYDVFGQAAYLIRDPDLVKQITITDFNHFVNHNFLLEQDVDPIVSRSLFFMQGERWRHVRATMSPSFSGSRMRAMHELIVRCSQDFVNTLKELDDNHASRIHDAKALITKYSNDMISTTALGVDVNTLKNPDNEFYKTGIDITDFGFWANIKFIGCLRFPSLMKALKVDLISEKSRKFMRNVINDNIEQRKTNKIVRNDFIDVMIRAKDDSEIVKDDADDDIGFSAVSESTANERPLQKPMTTEFTTEDIVAQCVTFYIGGIDTISNTLSFMLHELAINPDIQTKLYNEIETMRNELKGKPLNYSVIKQLKYLDMVLSETMRRWSTLPFTDRLCNKAYVLENSDGTKVLLNPGNSIIIPVYALQMDEKYFKNPEKFDPERFSDENKSSIHSGTFMPFGIGPRACIATRFALMVLKTFTFYLLSEFVIVKCEKTQHPLKLKSMVISMAAEKGIFVELRPRHA